MKLYEIGELNGSSSIADIYDFIITNCQPYLNENTNWINMPLYRGVKGFKEAVSIHSYPVNRPARDTSELTNKILIHAFSEAGIKANRDNSIFCSGSQNLAYSYAKDNGSIFVVYPIGDFDFCWSPSVRDLYVHSRSWLDDFVSIKDLDKPIFDQETIFSYVLKNLYFKLGSDNYTVMDKWCKELTQPVSMNELLSAFKEKTGMTISKYEVMEWNNYQGKKILELGGIDDSKVVDEIKQHYQSTDLASAIKSKHEITITGSKYLLLNLDTCVDLESYAMDQSIKGLEYVNK